MKRIDGIVTVGSPWSIERYKNAHSMCPPCWLDRPDKVMGAKFIMIGTQYRVEKKTCYVCEGVEYCYPIE